MSTNLSKQKRDDLLSKISAIRAYISAAPQDENTDSLLIYLSDLERDVNGKKYGLIFEEHQEAIDTVLAEHTPVLTEETELLIENGGEMNFLLEGDRPRHSAYRGAGGTAERTRDCGTHHPRLLLP